MISFQLNMSNEVEGTLTEDADQPSGGKAWKPAPRPRAASAVKKSQTAKIAQTDQPVTVAQPAEHVPNPSHLPPQKSQQPANTLEMPAGTSLACQQELQAVQEPALQVPKSPQITKVPQVPLRW